MVGSRLRKQVRAPFGCRQGHIRLGVEEKEKLEQLSSSSPLSFKNVCILFCYVFEISVVENPMELITCKARFDREDVVQLPVGREFLSKKVAYRGDYFITFYWNGYHDIELVKAVKIDDLKDFKDD